MVSIIIPVHNQIEHTQACIESIVVNTDDYEIIIVDNGSEPPTHLSYEDWDWKSPNDKYPKYQNASGLGEIITIIRNEENLGFPKAVNQGVAAAKGDIIAILNNDLVLSPHYLEILQSHLSNGFDMVGSVTNSISGPQQVLIDQYEDLASLYKAAQAHSKKNEGQSYPYHRLVFFCVAIKREVINKIGLLDEIYTPGNYEDDDFCMRAIEAGFKLGIAKDCYVHHFGSITHKAMDINYQELLAKNQKIFNKKWTGKYQEMIRKNNQIDGAEIVFTGERAIPLDSTTPPDVMEEHWARYKYAVQFVKGKKVLDVACGAGYGSALFAETAESVIGGDISSETIAYCRSNYSAPRFFVFNICDIPYPENSYDIVVSFETIEHVKDGRLFLSEIIRVLKDDGQLIISCPLGGDCGNPYHLTYYQKGTFELVLRKYFNEVKMLYQRKDEFSENSISPNYCDTFTGEYAVAICTKKKEK